MVWGTRRPARDDFAVHHIARIAIQSRTAVHVYDAHTHHTGPVGAGRWERAVPGLALVAGDGGQQIVLSPGFDADTLGHIDIEGADCAGVELELPEGSRAARPRFDPVQRGPNGRARLLFGAGTVVMQVDANGDSRFERTITPQLVAPERTTGSR